MQSDHIFYCRPKLIFQHSGLWKYIKYACYSKLKQIEKFYSLIIILKIILVPAAIVGMGVWAYLGIV